MRHLPTTHIRFDGPFLVLWIVLLIGAVVLGRFFYRRTNPPVSPGLRATLLSLRMISLAILVLFLMEPVLLLTYTLFRKPVLGVLLDRSESMAIVDGKGSRQEALRRILEGPTLQALKKRCVLRPFEFAEETRALPVLPPDTLELTGRGTDVGRALDHATNALKEEHLAGLVLLTDGANNLGRDPVRAARAGGHPIYAVGIGDTEKQRDIRIVKVGSGALGYVGDRMPVEIGVASWGYASVRVPITITQEGEELAAGQLRLTGEEAGIHGQEQSLTLQIVPDRPGLLRYEVNVLPQENELSVDNNRQTFFVKVLKSRSRVLLLAGGPSADFAFLKRSLSRDKNIEVEARVAKEGGGFYEGAFPGTLAPYDLVILLDMPRKALLGGPERAVADFVHNGKAALVLGGPQTLGSDYRESLIAEALPVILSPDAGSYRKGSYPLEISQEGLSHVVTRIVDDPTGNAQLWSALPPLLAANNNMGPKTGATVLAVHPTLKHRNRKVPLIAVGRYGGGKVMVGAFSSFWRMDLMMWGIGQTNEVSGKLWNNAVRWLVTHEDASPVHISTDKRAYRGGERIRFEGVVYDERYVPQERAKVVATITSKEITRRVQLDEVGHGRYRAQVSELPPGDYAYTSRASVHGRQVGESTGEFSIGRYSLEAVDTRMNEALLSRIADGSGGKFYLAEAVHPLLDDVDFARSIVKRNQEIALWNSPWLIGFLVLLLTAEWTIRKRRGMV